MSKTGWSSFLSVLDNGGRRLVWYDVLMRFLIQPLALISNILKAYMAWQHAYLMKFESYQVAKATMETLAFLMTLVAVVFTIGFSAMFAFAGPLMYTAMLVIRTLFALGSAIFFSAKAMVSEAASDYSKYMTRAKDAAVDVMNGAIAISVLFFLMAFAGPILPLLSAGLGVVASLVTGVILVARFSRQAELKAMNSAPPLLKTNNASLTNIFKGSKKENIENESCELTNERERDVDNRCEQEDSQRSSYLPRLLR